MASCFYLHPRQERQAAMTLEEAARQSVEIIDNDDRHPQTDAEARVLALLVNALEEDGRAEEVTDGPEDERR